MPGIHLPKLSEYDPVTNAEGALDPLGLYAIADNLAMRLVPGIRERMLHPRFLTAMAVGNVITRTFDEDQVAGDGYSQPYLVYEWHAVGGIVRNRGDDPKLSRLPGVLKVRECTGHLLSVIDIYETFSRLLQDAFDDCLFAMTAKRGRIGPDELSTTEGCIRAYRRAPKLLQYLIDKLEPYGLTVRFIDSFGQLADRVGKPDWTALLLDHHVKVQRRKPPNGKNPWFERFDDGTVVIRAGYPTS